MSTSSTYADSKKDKDVEQPVVEMGAYEADSKNLEAGRSGVIEHDAVFGDITEDGPNYRNIGWISTAIIMFKSNVGLGVLSLPSILSTLGMGPGLICIAVIGVMTTWGAYMIGVIKRKYPQVYCIDDMGYLIGGTVGREVLALASWLFMVFVAGAGMVGIATALNAISVHGACTAIFVAVACIATIIVSSIQTLGRIKFFGWVGVISIMAAIITLVIAVGVQDRPSEAPQEGPWNKIIINWGSPKFSEASAAISGIVLAYAGAPTYFPMVSEMKNPNHFTRAVLCSQIFVVVLYLVLGGVVYHYVGQFVATPALGSAGPLLKRVCYGLALPGLLVSTVLYTHFSAKYIFVRSLRGSDHLSRNTVKHWIVWLGCVLGCAIFAYVIASAIPAFGSLVSLIGAALGTLVCLQPFGAFWLWDNWKRPVRTTTWYLMVVWCSFIIIVGFFLLGAGTYGSVVDIINVYKKSGGSAWSCADNSNSV